MDDKDNFFAQNNTNDNDILSEHDNTDSQQTIENIPLNAHENTDTPLIQQETNNTPLPENEQPQPSPQYDRFMYEPIGFEQNDMNTDFSSFTAANEMAETKRKRSKHEKRVIALLLLIFLAIIFLIGFCAYIDISKSTDFLDDYKASDKIIMYRRQKPASDDKVLDKDKSGKYTTEGVADVVRPSIVEIYTYTDESTKERIGSGSGIILSDDGYIVTNAHVLSSEGYHIIKTSNDKQYNAKIIGRDVKTDIAVVKIEASNLTAATLGDSDELIVGEQVMAIGNPAGLSGTVTDGIVSAVNRKVKGDSTGFEMNCIQTNADISPGNSGGALVNMYGQVVGITSSKYVSSSYEGLGFAITINEAMPIIEELIDTGYVSGRFRIGITFVGTEDGKNRENIEQELKVKLPEDFKGIYITDISEDSSIAKTDLKTGDFIVEVAGVPIKNYDELYAVVKEFDVGEKIKAKCVHFDDKNEKKEYEIEFELMSDTSGNY